MSDVLKEIGFAFNPFEYLDSERDKRLYQYLVIPKTVESVLLDQPVAVLAQPGGGKSALRLYTWRFYRGSRGVKFPIAYVPETYAPKADFHFEQLSRALAREAFLYLTSYPDLFSGLPLNVRSKLKHLFSFYLPIELDYLLSKLQEGWSLLDYERLLDTDGFLDILTVQPAHHRLAEALKRTPSADSFYIEEGWDLLKEAFAAKSIHILIDGLDGFVETRPAHALMAWITPLLDKLEEWARKDIYLKFFIPVKQKEGGYPMLKGLQVAELGWDDHLLAEVVRRRVYVASRGAFDSLDAISELNLRNVELKLAASLPPNQKLPRQIIKKVREILINMVQDRRSYIKAADLFAVQELRYA